jgi:hypothetical protein
VSIPVEFLVTHRTIMWDDHAQEVTIYHIELEAHDVLLANGAPAESYRDDGNRWLFQNANSGWGLPPREPCAPVLTGGPMVDTIWQRLLKRAGPRQSLPLTDDADLHLSLDGRRLDAAERVGDVYVFQLPVVPSALNVLSHAASPEELGLARDPRVLGVALRRLVARKGTRLRVIEAKDEQLTRGFHAFEADNGFRWTDGDAAIPAGLYAGLTAPLEMVPQGRRHDPLSRGWPSAGPGVRTMPSDAIPTAPGGSQDSELTTQNSAGQDSASCTGQHNRASVRIKAPTEEIPRAMSRPRSRSRRATLPAMITKPTNREDEIWDRKHSGRPRTFC